MNTTQEGVCANDCFSNGYFVFLALPAWHSAVLYAHNHLLRTYRVAESRRVLGASSAIICVSDSLANQTEPHLPAELRDRVRIVRNGVDFEAFHRDIPLTRSGPLKVLFVGRMIPDKEADAGRRSNVHHAWSPSQWTRARRCQSPQTRVQSPSNINHPGSVSTGFGARAGRRAARATILEQHTTGGGTMRIAINAALRGTRAGYRQTGVSRYVSELVAGLERTAPHGDELLLLGAAPGPLDENPVRRIVWEQMALPITLSRRKVDVFHGPVNVVPLVTHVPCVVTVHDLAFLKFSGQVTAPRRAWLTGAIRASARRARRVITVSESTRADLIDWLALPEEVVRAIPLGVSPHIKPISGDALDEFKRSRQIERPFVLTVGTIEPRKNLPTLLRAFSQIKDRVEQDLILVGPDGWLTGDIRRTLNELSLGDRIHMTGFVADDELGSWYSAADAFAFPSFYEGFGLPVAEAMSCGTPVVASDSSSIPEVVGDAGVLIPPDNVDAWADALSQLLADRDRMESLGQLGRARSRAFSWDRTAVETHRVYRECMA